jgi:hypothetical protein
MFLEMTTLKQRLVRKKNRKLRRLRELYPDVRIKLFYARDFRAMMLKYGRLGLAESLSGTVGQVVPDRPVLGPEQPAGIEAPSAIEDAVANDEPAGIEALIEHAMAPVAPVATDHPLVADPPSLAPVDRSTVPAPRATPRSRSGRRRRRAALATQAGADLEAKA